MRFALSVLIIASLSAIATMFLPWWMTAVVAFVVALFMQLKPGMAFLSGFIAIALFWLIAILVRDIPNEHILSVRMAKVFGLSTVFLFVLVNIILGGLVGGMAGWSGGLMNRAFRK